MHTRLYQGEKKNKSSMKENERKIQGNEIN